MGALFTELHVPYAAAEAIVEADRCLAASRRRGLAGAPPAGESVVKQTVGEAMHPGVITCPPGATLRRVAAILAEHRIHAVVVAREEDSVPLAVVTDRDVAFRHSRGELDGVTAGGAAMEPTVTVRADADLRQAAELMAQYGTSHVIVTERGGRHPIGVLSTLDVAAAVAAG